MAPPQEKARYVGEGGNVLADGTVLIPGETVALVPKAEAQASDVWEPIGSAKKTASKNARNAAPDGTPPGPPAPDPEPEAA